MPLQMQKSCAIAKDPQHLTFSFEARECHDAGQSWDSLHHQNWKKSFTAGCAKPSVNKDSQHKQKPSALPDAGHHGFSALHLDFDCDLLQVIIVQCSWPMLRAAKFHGNNHWDDAATKSKVGLQGKFTNVFAHSVEVAWTFVMDALHRNCWLWIVIPFQILEASITLCTLTTSSTLTTLLSRWSR